MNFSDAVSELEKRGVMPETAPDLERMKKAIESVGFYKWPFWQKNQNDLRRIILVAGTNGKGSTCAMLESLLRHAGEKTGFYSSPHLAHYGERIRVNGQPLSEELFTLAYAAIADKTKNLKLTHFEVLTLMALWIFASGETGAACDRMILEVGLGGRWDATNAVPHGVSVFSPIDFDHQNLLGSTLAEIAANKLDIVRENSLNVHWPFPPVVHDVVKKVRDSKKGRWIESPSFPFSGVPGHPPNFEIKTPWGATAVPLAGLRGAENASLALTVFKALGFDPVKHLEGLRAAAWPARMNLLKLSPAGTPIYLSGDHNPHGIRSLISLLEFYPRRKLFIVAAIGKDKDRDGILGPLFELPKTEIVLTQTKFRFLPLRDYGSWLTKAKAKCTDGMEALDWAQLHAEKEDMILVTGSLYLAGEIMGSFNSSIA